ncbi:MAG TPA: hypothetical protein VFC67_20860 [Prolixibacteraceae bacterium]|nr:hypothetical protein [Prolixibacteraceae bacterium]
MIISAKEMCDNADNINIKQNLRNFGGGGLEVWKKMVIADERLFNQLFQLIFSEDKRLAWRSCWIVDAASEEVPELIADKIPAIITGLTSTKNSALKRHFTRILCRYKISEEYLGVVVNKCFELLVPSELAAVRVFAMQLLYNISHDLPDLKVELICMLEGLMEEGASAGFLNRSGKLLRQLRS